MEDEGIIANLITVMRGKKGDSIVGKIIYGEESILRAAEREPDRLLMDINRAAVMHGVTAVRFIFQLFQYPIVFLTALCDEQLFERARNAQFLKFILKLFTTHRDLSSNSKPVF